jgi:uncharacterized membrane protein YeaQ/YmgE (transglycosylase-associated protein family)
VRRYLLDRTLWAIPAVMLAGLLADAVTTSPYARGAFSLAIAGVFGWVVGGLFMTKPLREFLMCIARATVVVGLGALALPVVSGLVQVPNAGLGYLSDVAANAAAELRRMWPAICIVGVLYGIADRFAPQAG